MTERGSINIAQDISILYELSLAIGTSLDIRTNCDVFLKALIARKNLDFAAVWLKNPHTGLDGYTLAFAAPKIRITTTALEADHPLILRLKDAPFWTVESSEEAFDEAITERLLYREGAYAVFPLGTIGFLKLYDSKRRLPFYTRELNQLKTVVNKFGVSLESSVTHQALLEEITERQQATKRLTESETRKSAILEASLDAVITIDEFSRILEFNPSAERIFGYLKGEVLGKSLAEQLITPEHREALRQGIQNYLRTGQGPVLGKHMEMKAVHKNGTLFPVELAVTPIEISGRRLFTAYIRDITERKRAEEELIRANQIAEQSVRSKERFLANMSHEMRTPLNAVIGLTHLLEETSLTRQQSRYLEAIQFSAGSLLALINDILDFAKIDAGKIEFEQTPFRLEELLNGLYAMLRFTAERKGLKLVVSKGESLPIAIMGDQVRLRQILLNLIGNAIKFTEKGHVRLHVQSVQKEHGKNTLQFSVEDTGIGISEDKLPHIFDSFSQAASDTTRKYGGTGLGLAIVKELVEQQGGRIEVQSTVGQGSSFIVTLSFLETHESDAPAPSTGAKEIEHSLEGVRVLIVEDNEMNQYVAHQMLTRWGAKVDIAENGLIAIEKVRDNQFDIILMDIQMPEMDGFAATRYIRQDLKKAAEELPIIALTASMLADSKAQVYEAGMNDFVLKPFDPVTLRRVLLSYWQKVREERAKRSMKDVPKVQTPSPQVQAVLSSSPAPAQKPAAVLPVLPDQSAKPAVATKPAFTEPQIEVRPTPSPVVGGDSLSPVINLSHLMENSLGNKEFVTKMIDLFLMQAPEQIYEIAEFWKRSDFAQVKFIAHKMKSSARLLGIDPLADRLQSLEQDLSSGKTLRQEDGRIKEIVQYGNAAIQALAQQRKQMTVQP